MAEVLAWVPLYQDDQHADERLGGFRLLAFDDLDGYGTLTRSVTLSPKPP